MSPPPIADRRTDDGRFTYGESGPADAPALVFVHGIGGGARLWTRQLESFGGPWRAIAWDMPGYGGSAPLGTASVAAFAGALAAFLAALDLRAPVLVGHSLGGMVVQEFLAARLGPARAAVLAQTSAAFGGRDPRWAEEFVAARLGPLDRGATMADLAREGAADMAGDDPDADGMALFRAVMAETPPGTFRASTRGMIGFDRREALPRLAIPVLLLAGSRDAQAPAPNMARMAERIPGARLFTEEGAGHLLMLERPDVFDRELSRFLDALPGVPA